MDLLDPPPPFFEVSDTVIFVVYIKITGGENVPNFDHLFEGEGRGVIRHPTPEKKIKFAKVSDSDSFVGIQKKQAEKIYPRVTTCLRGRGGGH